METTGIDVQSFAYRFFGKTHANVLFQVFFTYSTIMG